MTQHGVPFIEGDNAVLYHYRAVDVFVYVDSLSFTDCKSIGGDCTIAKYR